MKKEPAKDKVSTHTFEPLNGNSTPSENSVCSHVPLSDATSSVKSSIQSFGIPICTNSEIANFMTPAMVQELFEKLEDKNYLEQCEKDMNEMFESLKKPFFVKIKD